MTYAKGNTADMESVPVSRQNSGCYADDVGEGKYCTVVTHLCQTRIAGIMQMMSDKGYNAMMVSIPAVVSRLSSRISCRCLKWGKVW